MIALIRRRLLRWWRVNVVAEECRECASRGIEQVPATRCANLWLSSRDVARMFGRRGHTATVVGRGNEWIWLCADSARRLGVPNPGQDDR